MRVLLDTHTLLWAAIEPAKLSTIVKDIIGENRNTIFVSAASAWEISTKVRLGKLPEAEMLERQFIEKMHEAGYTILPIETECALRAGRLTASHGDPFDRILAAQALGMDIPILSIDAKLDQFGVRRIW